MRLMLIAATALVLGACYPPEGVTKPEDGTVHIRAPSTGSRSATIQGIVLDDGTRCVVLLGDNKSGISCDWGCGRLEEP